MLKNTDIYQQVLLILFIIYHCNGFNLDLRSALIHQSRQETMFGFSVALHRDNRGYSCLLVGAPQDQTNQQGVVRGGAVHCCSTVYSNSCKVIPFDTTGHGKIFYRGQHKQIDDKSMQWFGATVHSSGESGIIVACAPRYIYFSSNLRRRDPVGTCWVAKSLFSDFKEYSPCRTTAWGYHRQGSCQAGFSAAVSKDGKRLFIGAVGSWYWQGQVFSQSILDKQLYSTNEAPDYDDDSYLGYSVAVGKFSNDSNSDVAVGMPRGNNLTGKVLLFNSTLYIIQNITGDQIGSYFGYSVAVCDVNGDDFEDVIIGAPLFSDLSSKIGNYENGRVYIRYQSKQHTFEKQDILDGEYSKGRFGHSITSLGDMNMDSYQDVAVSAPYCGDDGTGIVYIFHGSRKGIIQKPTQIIRASDFRIPLTTFGFSLSGGLDLDNNGYPDLLIGAYESDSAIFLKSRPIVLVDASLKIEPENINLEEKGCSLRDGSLVSCMVVSFCMEYTGINVNPDLGFVYEMQLDAKKDIPRVYFLDNEDYSQQNVSISLRKDSLYCKSIYAYVETDVRDKLIPITVQVKYILLEQRNDTQEIYPILNEAIPSTLIKQTSIRKNCGKDNVCIPDLQLSVSTNMKAYIIGSRDRIDIEIIIENAGEDAFETMLYLVMPLEINYININKNKNENSVSCNDAQQELTGNTKGLICDIGNPLPADNTIQFTIMLKPSRIISSLSNFDFVFIVNSTNEETENTTMDNMKEIQIPLRVKVDVTLHGISDPKVIQYNSSEITPVDKISETDAGPEVTHIYAFGNRGPSMIQEAEVNILWPTYTLYGKHLLYLMEQPQVKGNGKCQPAQDINPLSLKSENRSSKDKENKKVSSIKQELIQFRQERETLDDEDPYVRELICGPTLCTRFYCTIYELAENEHVVFIIRSRLWKDTIDQLGFTDVQISSKLVTRITSLPYNVDIADYPYKVYSISTRLNSEESEVSLRPIPLWIFILAVTSGLLLLGILALLLWKFGFFRRRRPQDELLDEEPLRKYEKNGYVWSAEDVML